MRSIRFLWLAPCLGLLLTGCGPKEPVSKPRTVQEIDAQIKKIQDDPNMPPQAKGPALGGLSIEREAALKRGSGKK